MVLGGACLLALSVMRLWLAEGRPAVVSAVALSVGALWLFLNAGVFFHTTRVGKFAVWAELLDRLELKGDERLLDIGCGRGAVLLMAAERLPRGRAVGVDLWSTTDQSGNAEQVTRGPRGYDPIIFIYHQRRLERRRRCTRYFHEPNDGAENS